MSAGDGPSRRDRILFLLAENEALVLACCLLLVLGGGFVAYQAHTAPDTTTEQRVAGTWTTNTTVDHAAVVRDPSLAFEEGAVLRNRSLYFRSTTPILEGAVSVTHEGSPSDVSTTTDLRLVVRSVDGGENGRVLWEISEPIDTVRSTGPGPTRVPFEVNVTEQVATAARVQEDLQTTQGQRQIRLVAETRTQATVAGESRSQRRRDVVRIQPHGGLYQVDPANAGEQTETVRETVTVPIETDPLRAYGSLAVVVVGLVTAVVIRWLDREGALAVSPATATAIQSAKERESFDEWISRGSVPPPDDDERVVDVDSLEDLVDVAIDSDRRVIEDASGEYVVLDGATRYRFRSDGAGVATPSAQVATPHSGAVTPDGATTRDGATGSNPGDSRGPADGDT